MWETRFGLFQSETLEGREMLLGATRQGVVEMTRWHLKCEQEGWPEGSVRVINSGVVGWKTLRKETSLFITMQFKNKYAGVIMMIPEVFFLPGQTYKIEDIDVHKWHTKLTLHQSLVDLIQCILADMTTKQFKKIDKKGHEEIWEWEETLK